MDLKDFSNDDLINELFSRFDDAIFTSVRHEDSKSVFVDGHYGKIGNGLLLIERMRNHLMKNVTEVNNGK
jgi:hypothetical protein